MLVGNGWVCNYPFQDIHLLALSLYLLAELRRDQLAFTVGLEVNWRYMHIADAPPLMEALTTQDGSRTKRPTHSCFMHFLTAMRSISSARTIG